MKIKLLIFIIALFIFSFKIISLANAQYKCDWDCGCLSEGGYSECDSSPYGYQSCDSTEDVCGVSCSYDTAYCGVVTTPPPPTPTPPPLTCPGACFLNTDFSGICSHYSTTYTTFKSYNDPDCYPGSYYSWICCVNGPIPATPTPTPLCNPGDTQYICGSTTCP